MCLVWFGSFQVKVRLLVLVISSQCHQDGSIKFVLLCVMGRLGQPDSSLFQLHVSRVWIYSNAQVNRVEIAFIYLTKVGSYILYICFGLNWLKLDCF